jgi:hypothetical protein
VEWKSSSEPRRGGTLLAPPGAVLACAVPVGAVLAGAAAGADRRDAARRGFAGTAEGVWVSEAIAGATGCSRSTE